MTEWHPTQDQIEAVARAMQSSDSVVGYITTDDVEALARTAIAVLAPMVAEDAAKVAEGICINGIPPSAPGSIFLQSKCFS